jgi:hypothetical protein
MNEVNCTAIRRGLDCGATGFADCAMHLTRKGAVDCYRGAMRCAYYTLRLLTASGRRAGFCPPVVRRGEGTRSGAPSWTTAQTQAVQGCTVCVVPPDLLPEPREPDTGGRTSGGVDLWCYLPKRAGLSKVTRPAAQRRRNPVEGSALVSCMAKPCQYLVAGQRRYRTPHPNPLPQGERGLLPRTITLR